MRPLSALVLVLVTAAAGAPAAAQAPAMGVDPRVELLSIIFRLAGNPEYNQGEVSAYEQAIAAHFGPHREHDAVRIAAEFREGRGVSYDAVMSMAIHLSDAGQLLERVPFDHPASALDARWGGAEARRFLEAARRFVVDARYAEFRAAQRALDDTTNARLRRLLERGVEYQWFDGFFGAPPGGRFVLVPGLANGGGSYGPKVVCPDGQEELYAIIGVWQVDSAGLPTFTESMIGTVVHEFNHSHVNPVVARHAAALEEAGRAVYRAVEAVMRAQAYGNWKTMVDESLVRASVVRYLHSTQGRAVSARAAAGEEGRGFVWTSDLAALLAEYEASRDRYPDFASFMPRVAKYFAALAPRIEEVLAAYEARRPRLVGLTPDTTGGVDAIVQELVFEFDRPMAPGYSIGAGPAGRPAIPALSRPGWDATRTRFSLGVTLEPGRSYEFSLNTPTGGSFRTEDGVPLRQVLVRFRTRGEGVEEK